MQNLQKTQINPKILFGCLTSCFYLIVPAQAIATEERKNTDMSDVITLREHTLESFEHAAAQFSLDDSVSTRLSPECIGAVGIELTIKELRGTYEDLPRALKTIGHIPATDGAEERYIYLYRKRWRAQNCLVVETAASLQCSCFGTNKTLYRVWYDKKTLFIVVGNRKKLYLSAHPFAEPLEDLWHGYEEPSEYNTILDHSALLALPNTLSNWDGEDLGAESLNTYKSKYLFFDSSVVPPTPSPTIIP